MKLFKLLFVAIIAFGMVACNNEDEPQVIDGPEATISVKVFPSSNSPGVRSVGDLSDADATTSLGLLAESTIHNLQVWVFNGEVLTGYGSANGAEVTDIEAVAGASTVVVVANAGIGFKATKAELLDEVKGLPAEGITGGLVMTAEPIDVTLEAGNNYYGYTEAEFTDIEALDSSKKTHLDDDNTALPLVRVNARVALVAATLNYDAVPATQKAAFDNLRDVEVAMFNVPEKTNLFYARTAPSASFLATNADFQFGAAWLSPKYSYVGVGTGTPNPVLFDKTETDSSIELPITAASAPYYYVNENTSEVAIGTSETPAQKMFMVLRAKVYKGGTVVTELKDLYTDDEGYTYYPIWVNALKDNYTYNTGHTADGNVYRNTQYNISLVIKGLGRPTIDEVDKAWLDVKVKVAPWIVVTQDVEW